MGRFAPSPTGRLHLGSLVGALVSYLDARQHGGQWLLRIEDIDPPREVAGASDAILSALKAHGLAWDGEPRYQRNSRELHDAAIAQLLANGDAYYCRCARRRLIASGHASCYPGICRNKGYRSGALRVRVNDQAIVVQDRWQPAREDRLSCAPGDFIVRRRDGLIAYQLAVVVDDADQGVTDVVRGVDLYDSTARQIWLQRLLGLPTPRYAHFPVVVDASGDKLSKQTGAIELDIDQALSNLRKALSILGLPPPASGAGQTPAALLSWAEHNYDRLALNGRQSLLSET